jgi:hypothetical protein
MTIKDKLKELRDTIKKELAKEDLVSPNPISIQNLIGFCRESLQDLLYIRTLLRPKLRSAERDIDIVKGSVAIKLKKKLPASSPLISAISKLIPMTYGPTTGNEWGLAPVDDLFDFYHTENDELIAETLFNGAPPKVSVPKSFAEIYDEVLIMSEEVEDLISLVKSIQQDIPNQHGLIKLEASL